MKRLISFYLAVAVTISAYAQNAPRASDVKDSALQSAVDLTFVAPSPSTNAVKFKSPYKIRFITDAPIIAGGVGLTALGVSLIDKKDPLTEDKLSTMNKKDLPFFDRGNAGYYSESADRISYIPFDAAFVMPVALMLVNKNERQNAGQILVMYTETMAITGALFTLSAGTIDRSRPLVYGTKAPIDKRLNANAQRSFFAGHTAATAAATFFMAKVFSDLNPDSKARPYVWVVAATMPAAVGYLRYKAGQHFLSDNIVGYVLGAGAGILVPQLHKTKVMKNISMVPVVGENYRGISFTYHFRSSKYPLQ